MITMKKLTLLSIIMFTLVVGGIFVGHTFLDKDDYQQANLNKDNYQQANLNKDNYQQANLNKTTNNKKIKTFTVDEVSKHHTRNDCYLIINKKVYDVSSYINYHPGGTNSIISNCGKEVTGIFARIHSNSAWDLLKKYKVGIIVDKKVDITN